MDVKYQIFVSSTYRDLKDERNEIFKAILEMNHIPVGMEMFSAADEEQWRIITRTIDQCDYYVVIIAHRYGSTTGDISYTEKEYDYAVEQGVPILGFIIADNVQWNPRDIDEGRKRQALENFKNKVKTRMISYWSSAADLYGKCSIALMKQFDQNPRPGWVRVSDVEQQRLAYCAIEDYDATQILKSTAFPVEVCRNNSSKKIDASLLDLFLVVGREITLDGSKSMGELNKIIGDSLAGGPDTAIGATWVFCDRTRLREFVARLIALGLVERSQNKYFLTEKGRDVFYHEIRSL